MRERRRGLPRGGLTTLRGDDGQSLVFIAIALVVILGMLGLVLDTGKVYVTQRQLQTATDAAALAAAQALPDASAANLTGCEYSATDGNVNGDPCFNDSPGDNIAGLAGVTTQITPECLSQQSTGIDCTEVSAPGPCDAATPMPPNGNYGCNAVQVTETVKIHPWLLGALGIGDQTITSTSTASMAGGNSIPLDVEMIDDVTPSMQTHDTCGGTPTDVPASQSGNLTQEDCAKAGIRALLSSLEPCLPSLASCNPQGADNGQIPAASRLDEVGLVVFPGLVDPPFDAGVSGVPQELNCTSDLNNLNRQGQSLDETYTTTATTAPEYQIVPFSSDFRYSDTATRDPLATLYPTSHLVQAVYWPGDGCPNGGYPVTGGGGSNSSIAGGGAGDYTAANNNSSPAGGGVATATDRNATANAGIAQGQSTLLPQPPIQGIAVGNSKPAVTTPGTIGGGSGTGSSGDRFTTSKSNVKSVGLTMPTNTGGTDSVLVTITAQGNVTSTSSICAPSGSWTPIKQDYSAGNAATPAIMEATFYGTRGGANDIGTGTYTFGFFTGACPAAGSLPGTPNLTVSATSGIAVRYSNVAGIDTAQGGGLAVGDAIGPATTTSNGSATSTLLAPMSFSNAIGNTTWSNTRYVSLASNCSSGTSTTRCDDAVVPAAGTFTSIGFTLGTATGNTTTYAVTLLVNGGASTLTCTIPHNSNQCGPSTGSAAVNTGNNVELQIVKGGAGGSVSASATVSATTSAAAPAATYVSLASACSNASVTQCDDMTVAPPGGTLTTSTLTFGSAVPMGDTFTVTLFQNGVATGSTCNVTQTGKTCTINANIAVATGDNLELQVARTGGAAAFTSSIAQTTATITSSGRTITAPSVTTTSANDVIVRVFGTGSAGFSAANGVLTVSGTSTSTGVDDAQLATPGPSNTESVTSSTTDNWVAQTIAFKPANPTGISLTVPTGYVGGGTNLLLATIAVQSLGAGNQICTPTGWTPVTVQHSGPGAAGGQGTVVSSPDATGVTQESFWSMAPTANLGLTFNFASSCPQTGTNAVHAGASAVVTNYTGVDAVNPIDTVTNQSSPQATAGTTSPLSALPVTTSATGEEVVGLYATDATGIAVSGTGVTTATDAFTSSGDNSQVQGTPGASTPKGATSTPAAAGWTSETVALRPSLSSAITVSYPADFGTNDTLFVSIAVQGLGGGSVCKPSGGDAANWHQIATTTSGTGPTELTQSTWWTSVFTATSSVFDFSTSMDNTTGLCTGTALEGGASAIATTYSGVDVVTTPPTVVPNSGSSATPTALAPTGAGVNDEVVSFFATNDDFKAPLPAVHNTTHSPWANSGEIAAPGPGGQTQVATTNSANWTAQTITLKTLLPTSITITPPSGYTQGGGNLLLVSIAAQGLAGGSICEPDATWKPIPVSPASFVTTSGTMTQETFYTTTNTAATDTFTFYKNRNCTGAYAHVAASAVSVVYTGIDPVSPIDATYASATGGAGAPMTAASITPTVTGDEIAVLYDTSATTLTGTTIASTGGFTNSGANDSIDNGAPNVAYAPPGTVTSTPAVSDWTEETVALRPLGKNGITIARPPNPVANSDFLLIDVTAKGLPAGASICAPNDGTWTQQGATVTQSTPPAVPENVTQALFYSLRISGQAESYSFTFRTGGCGAGGTPVAGNATAIAVRFTGVEPVPQFMVDGYQASTGNSKTIAPPAVAPPHTGDQIVGFYGAVAPSITVNTGGFGGVGGVTEQSQGTSTSTAFWDKTQSATQPPTGAITTANDWVGQTIVLQPSSSSCATCVYGAEDPDGESTSYGLAIAAAEAALNKEAQSRPTAQKVIVILSDGDANINEGNPTTLGPCQYGLQQAELAEDTTKTTDTTQSGNTWFFVVAYGANYDQTGRLTAKSCQLDTAARGSTGVLNGLSAQCTLQLIADNRYTNPDYAGLTDAQVEAKICGTNVQEPTDSAHHFYSQEPGTSLEQTFTQIAEQATQPRLISNSAT